MSLQQLRKVFAVTSVEINGTPTEIVRSSGRSSPVILLPGAQGTAEIFYNQLLAWGSERDMVSVTYPASTDCVALADHVVRLADALGFGTFDVVGSSLGGHVAQWIASRHLRRVRKLVAGNSFADPAPSQAPDRLAALQSKSADAVKAEAMGRLEASPAGELRDVLLDLVGKHQPAEMLKARMMAVQLTKPMPPPVITASRVLLIECDNDPLIAPAGRAAIRAHYAGAACHNVSGGGHYPYVVKAADYNAAVGSFLAA